MRKSSSLGVIILGAGASSRMGCPKLLLPWQGTSVIGHLISQWRGVGAAQITVVLRPNDAALAAELERLGFPKTDAIPNSHPEQGMFSSIVCAANWPGWQPGILRWAIVLGDQPHLRLETLRQLVEFSATETNVICQPAYQGRPAHPVILPPSVFAGLKCTPAANLKDFLNLSGCRSVHCVIDDPGLKLDMDTPEDYRKALVSNIAA